MISNIIIPTFTSIGTGKKGIPFDSLINRFMFKEFVDKKERDFNKISLLFNELKKTLDKSSYSAIYWSNDRCKERLSEYFKQYSKNEKSKKLGFLRQDSPLNTILYRFKQNNSAEAFLAQKNIASVLGLDQVTISRYIKEFIRTGYLIRLSLGNNLTHKASKYRLTQKSIEIIDKIWGGFKKFMQKSKEVIEDIVIDAKSLINKLANSTKNIFKDISEDREFKQKLARKQLYKGEDPIDNEKPFTILDIEW